MIVLLFGATIGFGPSAAFSAESAPAKDSGQAAQKDEKETDATPKKGELPVPKETSSVTHHTVKASGQEIPYTATAGTLLINKGDDPVASFFYVAYTRDEVKDMSHRPVTFFYNGGPGSATIWLHMGSYGPRIVETVNGQPTGPAPYHVVENGDTLLDRSDLVFIDAIGTGYSRVVGKGEGKDFWSVDGDIDAFAKFITRYITVNHRWNSPKFLFGESYGTPRSAGLVYKLQEQGMSFNGVVLLSSVLDWQTLVSPGLDEPYENLLPTYAAIAWFHDKLPNKPADLKAFLQTVRDYATEEYSQALAKGDLLSAAQRDAVAARLHEFTGLSIAYLVEANLKVKPGRFRKELLRDERLTVGRYDGRFEGVDFDAAGENPGSDPSETAIKGAFGAALHSYLSEELNYNSDAPYDIFSTAFTYKDWNREHKLPAFMGAGIPYPVFYMVGDLGQAMRENPGLKVLAANGYFDVATPFLGTERDLNHLGLDPALQKNVSLTYYESGHMVYLNPEARKAFRADLGKFYDSAAKP